MNKDPIIPARIIEDYSSWMNRNYHINISLKNGYIYVEVPKVASTTIKASLISLETEGTQLRVLNEADSHPIGHDSNGWVYAKNDLTVVPVHHHPVCSPFIKPYQLKRGVLTEFFASKDFVKFCFVRNPYSRILSAYLEKVKSGQPQGKQILRALGMKHDAGVEKLTFIQFLEALSNIPIIEMDPHWRPQWLLCYIPLIKYDFIGKFESFSEDFEKLNALLDMRLTSHSKRYASHGVKANKKLNEYYDTRAVDIVTDIYCKDFDYFGYSKNISE